jgi:hypothetical protein
MKMAYTISISILLVAVVPWNSVAQNARERSSFQWNDLPLRTSLDSLMKWYSESIVYLDKDVEGKEVSASCTNCTFDKALDAVLNGSSLIWIKRGNQIILKEQELPLARRYFTISGIVTDSITGEWIVGASVLLQDSAGQEYKTVRRWCPTNAFGFYSLPEVSPGRYTLVVHAIGYENARWSIDSLSEESVQHNINMIQRDIIMSAVTIEGHQTALATAEQFSRGAYRRSVPTDQNQYILDGGRIYNPTHFGGVLSTCWRYC